MGAIAGFFVYSTLGNYQKSLSNFIGVCMLLFLGLEYIPHIVDKYPFSGVLIGGLVAILIFNTLELLIKNNKGNENMKFPMMALLVGFILHSIPTGFALGIVSSIDFSLAIRQLKGMFFHHFSEGIAIFGLIIKQRRGLGKNAIVIVFCVVIISVAFYLSTLMGTIYEVNTNTATWVVGFSVGSLIYAFIHLFEK
ncbi:hypothetical protein [Rossellomorea aquimaris]|uniref:hypothetical protein n=1 Tax=Rossellomorea aquimaris TaxID=189382 RepID=UPI00115BE748|nr:hypothetical protein [Rossellomorea aquimaris]